MSFLSIRSLPKDDPFGGAGCVERERYLSCEWMRDHYKGPHAGFLFILEFDNLFSDIYRNTDADGVYHVMGLPV